MPVTIGWKEVALRLLATVIAGLVIGYNRGEHGRAAGMRTTLLVCLAASLSMILANLMMDSVGKTQDSFIVLDLMRLPLGVLSGIGFIGAGTILRKGSMVIGVTTAATMWFVTVMGLCFGGGQIALGTAALGLGLATLWGLKHVEILMRQDFHGTLSLTLGSDSSSGGLSNGGPSSDERIRQQIQDSGCAIVAWGITSTRQPPRRQIDCEIEWRARLGGQAPAVIAQLEADPTVISLSWRPQGMGSKDNPQ